MNAGLFTIHLHSLQIGFCVIYLENSRHILTLFMHNPANSSNDKNDTHNATCNLCALYPVHSVL